MDDSNALSGTRDWAYDKGVMEVSEIGAQPSKPTIIQYQVAIIQ